MPNTTLPHPFPTFKEKNFLSYRDRTSVVGVVFRIKYNFLAWWGCGFKAMKRGILM